MTTNRPTSLNGTKDGPDTMSAAFVPGLILLSDCDSNLAESTFPGAGDTGMPGDFGGS